MTDTPAGPLTLQHIRDRQREKGLRKYGVALKDAGLPVSALALHALEECVDLLAYLHAAGLLDLDDSVCLLSLADRLLPIADHPKPPPPDVPTAEAVAAYGPWWQHGTKVVQVKLNPNGLRFWRTASAGADRVSPGDPAWLGPVQLRPNPKEKP